MARRKFTEAIRSTSVTQPAAPRGVLCRDCDEAYARPGRQFCDYCQAVKVKQLARDGVIRLVAVR